MLIDPRIYTIPHCFEATVGKCSDCITGAEDSKRLCYSSCSTGKQQTKNTEAAKDCRSETQLRPH